MLLVHSLNEIKASIRRMCQNKLYLKQAPDIAPIASKELVFTYLNQDELIMKLKHLDSRVGALDYVSKKDGNTLSHDSMFIKTAEFLLPKKLIRKHKKNQSILMQCHIFVKDIRQKQSKLAYALKVYYLGEELCTSLIQGDSCTFTLLPDRYYSVDLMSEQMHKIASCKFFSRENVSILIDDFGAHVVN